VVALSYNSSGFSHWTAHSNTSTHLTPLLNMTHVSESDPAASTSPLEKTHWNDQLSKLLGTKIEFIIIFNGDLLQQCLNF